MANSNVEKFIIELGFADKEAVKGLKDFLGKVDKMSTKAGKTTEQKQEKGYTQSLKRKEAAHKAHLDRMRKLEIQNRNFQTVLGNDSERARDFLSRYETLSRRLYRQQTTDPSNIAQIDSTRREMDRLRNSINQTAAAMRAHTRTTLGLATAQRGLNDSTKHMIRSYASLFALFEGTRAINKTGQDFEALESAMLAAMGSQQEAANQIMFLDELTDRLGMSLLDTADQYTKFTFAAKGKLDTDQVNFLFQSMSELGTVLGVSKERMKLSFTAIQQMMNKTVVQSEELKRQFAESMPGGIQLFANALQVSEQELFQMMEQGQVLAKDVLPLVAEEMNKVANSAGALEQKYKTTRVQQGRFFKDLESARDDVFKGGADQGFALLFQDLSQAIKESEGGIKGLGQIYRLFANVIRSVAKIILPVIESVLFSFGKISEMISDLTENRLGQIILGFGAIGLAIAKMTSIAKMFNFVLSSIFFKLTSVIALADEFFAFFDDDRTNLLESALGRQINLGRDLSPQLTTAGVPDVMKFNPFFNAATQASEFVIHNYVDGVKTETKRVVAQEAQNVIIPR